MRLRCTHRSRCCGLPLWWLVHVIRRHNEPELPPPSRLPLAFIGFWTAALTCCKRLLQPKQDQQPWGTLIGAVRLGERASIGFGTWTSAHGGAIESVLDEATAELTKMEWATMVSTIEARGLRLHWCSGRQRSQLCK